MLKEIFEQPNSIRETVGSRLKLNEPCNFADLDISADYLKNVKRPECTKAIAAARAFGDLSENSEYVAAKEEQSMCESEINDL